MATIADFLLNEAKWDRAVETKTTAHLAREFAALAGVLYYCRDRYDALARKVSAGIERRHGITKAWDFEALLDQQLCERDRPLVDWTGAGRRVA